MSTEGVRLAHDWFDRDLPAGADVGERSWIYSSFAFLHCQTSDIAIGDDTGIYLGTMFDLGRSASLHIGRYCTIVNPVISSNDAVRIGDFVFVAHGVVIAGSPSVLPLGERTDDGGDIDIGDDCWLGAEAIVLGPATLGRGVIVGAGAVVTGDIPAFSIVAGNPGRIVGEAGIRARSTG